jgi:hypothetical protein
VPSTFGRFSREIINYLIASKPFRRQILLDKSYGTPRSSRRPSIPT